MHLSDVVTAPCDGLYKELLDPDLDFKDLLDRMMEASTGPLPVAVAV